MVSPDRRRRGTSRLDYLRTKSGSSHEAGSRPSFWRGIWPRVGTVALAAFAMTLLLAVGGPPFPYRIGYTPAREIRLATPLQIENVTETRDARERAAKEAPLVFEHNPDPIRKLVQSTGELARSMSKSGSFDELPKPLLSQWELTPETYEKLRPMFPNTIAAATFERSMRRVFEPYVLYGLLNPKELPEDAKREITPNTMVEIRPLGASVTYLHRLDEVSLASVPSDEGSLAQSLRTDFGEERAVTLLKLLAQRLPSTLTFDAIATRDLARRAMENVEPVVDEYPAGTLVVRARTPIGPDELRLLTEEHRKNLERRTWFSWNRYRRLLGMGMVVGIVVGATSLFLAISVPWFVRRLRWVVVLSLTALATLACARLFSIDPYRAQIVPLAIVAMYMTVTYGRLMGVAFSLVFSLLIALTQAEPFQEFAIVSAGILAGVLFLESVRSRTKLILVGLIAGSAHLVAAVGIGLLMDQSYWLILQDGARCFACGLAAGLIVSGTLPFAESLFGIVTDISLIELADTGHPLLQDLIRRAPGTYNHSVSVSVIGEAAAKAIGCNSLVVRVGALFHDVGKMLKPQYFIENKAPNEVNRHEQLAPAISTLIIIGHVKDGLELARQHHLPAAIMDIIEQHHGTTLVDYFFHEATRDMQNRLDGEEEVEESSFRYPGPKPQTKEAAVMMLSDCVEGASRALGDPTPSRIEKLVHNLTLNRLLDGQFDECGITLQEIQLVEQSLIKSLSALYHGRIKYPAAV